MIVDHLSREKVLLLYYFDIEPLDFKEIRGRLEEVFLASKRETSFNSNMLKVLQLEKLSLTYETSLYLPKLKRVV